MSDTDSTNAADSQAVACSVRPCPFCGSADSLRVAEGRLAQYRAVYCENCGAVGPEARQMSAATPEEWARCCARADAQAIRLWNERRTSEEARR